MPTLNQTNIILESEVEFKNMTTDNQTEQPIEQMNIVIGQFMEIVGSKSWMAMNCKYHSSWEELMPVVEKIESLGFSVQIGDKCFCAISKFENDENPFEGVYFSTEVDPIFGKVKSKIHGVWLACFQFIQWYNTINKQPQ